MIEVDDRVFEGMSGAEGTVTAIIDADEDVPTVLVKWDFPYEEGSSLRRETWPMNDLQKI